MHTYAKNGKNRANLRTQNTLTKRQYYEIIPFLLNFSFKHP